MVLISCKRCFFPYLQTLNTSTVPQLPQFLVCNIFFSPSSVYCMYGTFYHSVSFLVPYCCSFDIFASHWLLESGCMAMYKFNVVKRDSVLDFCTLNCFHSWILGIYAKFGWCKSSLKKFIRTEGEQASEQKRDSIWAAATEVLVFVQCPDEEIWYPDHSHNRICYTLCVVT